jgi:hypothetical protein
MFFAVVLGECTASAVGVDTFFFKFFIDRATLVVGRVITFAEYTPDSTRAFLPRALTRRMVASAFYAPRLEVAKVLGVPISLAILESGRQIVGQESSQSPVVRWLEERYDEVVRVCTKAVAVVRAVVADFFLDRWHVEIAI